MQHVLLKASSRLVQWLLGSHAFAFCLLFYYVSSGLLIVGLLMLALHAAVLAHYLLGARRVCELRQTHDEAWQLVLCNGEKHDAQLQAGSFVSAQLTILSFRLSRYRYRAVVIFPEMLSAEAFRVLRVQLLSGCLA